MEKTQAATAIAVLEAAERIAGSVGYSGLSFRDLAAAVGIKSASVHYHFPSKGLLGAAIARRYTDRLAAHLDAVDAAGAGPDAALAAYVAVFRAALGPERRMCLVGMLAAELDALPEEMRAEVRRFVALNVRWLSGVLTQATASPAGAGEHAMALFAALEGAVLVARGSGDLAQFDAIAAQFARMGLIPTAAA